MAFLIQRNSNSPNNNGEIFEDVVLVLLELLSHIQVCTCFLFLQSAKSDIACGRDNTGITTSHIAGCLCLCRILILYVGSNRINGAI